MVSAADFEQLLNLLRAFIRREVMPAEASIDESDEIPDSLIAIWQECSPRAKRCSATGPRPAAFKIFPGLA